MPLFLFLSTIYYLVSPISPVFAQQDFTFSRAFSDYIFTLDQYRTAHRNYDLKRSEYFKFKTLTSQTEAFQASADMLLKRDDAVRTHLTALRLKLAETPGVDPQVRESLYSRIDQEVNWLYQHQTRLQNTTNLIELTRISKELESRYPAIQLTMYQTLITLLAGKDNHLRTQTRSHYQTLKDKLAQIRDTGENTQVLDRWLVQADQRLTLSLERQTAAEISSQKLGYQTRNLPIEFTNLRFSLKDSHQYLKESVSYLEEIIHQIAP